MLLVLVLMATPRCQPAPSPPLPRRPPAQLQYAALHSYEDKPEDFMADTVVLRRRFTEDGEGGGWGGGGTPGRWGWDVHVWSEVEVGVDGCQNAGMHNYMH